jgi:hypothetical protein
VSGVEQKMHVFICYSRADTHLADQIADDLRDRGLDVKIDRRDLPYGEEWQKEISELIRGCDSIVWLASAHSIGSRWCNWELSEANLMSKRVLPVRIDETLPDRLPELLGRIHALPAVGVYDPNRHFDQLVQALETDRAWLKDHTRLSDRAAEWIARGQSRDRLLRGRALSDAELWRNNQPAHAPPASADTLDLIFRSRHEAGRRLRSFVALSIAVAAVMAVVSLVAVVKWRQADVQFTRAEREAQTATLQREAALIKIEANENPTAALERAVAAANTNLGFDKAGGVALLPEIRSSLFQALDFARELPPLKGFHDGGYQSVKSISIREATDASPPRVLIASDNVGLIADTKGRVVACPISAPDLGSAYANAAIWTDRSAQALAAVATGLIDDNGPNNVAVGLYDAAGLLQRRVLTDNPFPILSLATLPLSHALLAGDSQGSLFRIDLADGGVKKVYQGFGRPLIGIAAPDSEDKLMLAFGSRLEATTSDPTPSKTQFEEQEAKDIAAALETPELKVYAIGVGADETINCIGEGAGYTILTCDGRGGVAVWKDSYAPAWPSFSLVNHISVAGGRASAVAYDQPLDVIAIGDVDGGIQIFSALGQALTPILRHPGGPIRALAFLENGTLLLSAGGDSSIRRWDLSDLGGREANSPQLPSGGINLVVANGGGTRVFTASESDEGPHVTLLELNDADRRATSRKFTLPPRRTFGA